MALVDLRESDPFQGHDIFAFITSYGDETGNNNQATGGDLQNAFTDIMMKMVNQTETYLPLFAKVPRYLDGEIIIVWSASAGALSLDFVRQTFGNAFTNNIKAGRRRRVPRSKRFALSFYLATGETISSEASMNNPLLAKTGGNQRMTLLYCRCDTLSFGVGAGKGYAVNSWQGTAEALDDGANDDGSRPTDVVDPLAASDNNLQ